MGALRFDGADWVRFSSVASALSNVTDGAFTMAVLTKRASTSGFQALAYLSNAGPTVQQGASFQDSTNKLVIDMAGGSKSVSAFTDTASPYLFVQSKAAGSAAPTLSWKLGSAGSWTDETFDVALTDHAASTILELGTWQGGSDLLDGWLGVVGFWEGAMTAPQKQELSVNWRTSDWWASSFGQPECLIECNVAAASLVDAAGNASGLSVTGSPTLDAAETLDSWNFDGMGGAPGLPPVVVGQFTPGLVPEGTI